MWSKKGYKRWKIGILSSGEDESSDILRCENFGSNTLDVLGCEGINLGEERWQMHRFVEMEIIGGSVEREVLAIIIAHTHLPFYLTLGGMENIF